MPDNVMTTLLEIAAMIEGSPAGPGPEPGVGATEPTLFHSEEGAVAALAARERVSRRPEPTAEHDQ